MKNLLTKETVTIDFCEEVILETVKGKRKRIDAQMVLIDLGNKAEQLRNMILELPIEDSEMKEQLGVNGFQVFTPAPYNFLTREEHGKMRNLCQPQLWPDQCIHHALIKCAREKFMKRIDPYAAASIPGKGPTFLMTEIKHTLRTQSYQDTKYTLKLDIRKCFESLKSEVAYEAMTKIIKDPIWLRLFHKVIFNHPTLPIGLYISAWVINLILKPLDDKIRAFSGTNFYYRYMDDMIVIGPNKKKLKSLLNNIIVPELAKLGLEVKHNWRLFVTDNMYSDIREGIDFVGFRIYRNKVLMRKKNFRTLRHAALRMARLFKEGKYIPLKFSQSFVSFAAPHRQVTGKVINEYLLYAKYECVRNNISIRDTHNMKAAKYKVALFMRDPNAKYYKPVKLKNERLTRRRFTKLMKEMNRIGRLRHDNNELQKCTTYMERERYKMKRYPWKYLVPIELMDVMFCPLAKWYEKFDKWLYETLKKDPLYFEHFDPNDPVAPPPKRKEMAKEEEEAYRKKWLQVDRQKVYAARDKLFGKQKELLSMETTTLLYKEALSIYPHPSLPMTLK